MQLVDPAKRLISYLHDAEAVVDVKKTRLIRDKRKMIYIDIVQEFLALSSRW